jgi:asparagine synthase (glutamine-hydrolysing)
MCYFVNISSGHFITTSSGFVKYYRPDYEDYLKADQELNLEDINSTLTNAVSKRLMADVPLGVMLSGGLDSSLIASITHRILKRKAKSCIRFSIGLDGMLLM